jgi:hypothetical protein
MQLALPLRGVAADREESRHAATPPREMKVYRVSTTPRQPVLKGDSPEHSSLVGLLGLAALTLSSVASPTESRRCLPSAMRGSSGTRANRPTMRSPLHL